LGRQPLSFPSFTTFKATEWKWWAQGLRFADVRFDSKLERSTLIANYWEMILVVAAIGVIVGGIPFNAIPYTVWLIWDIDLQIEHRSPVLIGLFYLAFVLALEAVFRVYFVQRIWKFIATSVTVENLASADHVIAKGEAASAIGEGLADSLDVVGF
jgi:Bacterial protein of unknown function (DUF898)